MSGRRRPPPGQLAKGLAAGGWHTHIPLPAAPAWHSLLAPPVCLFLLSLQDLLSPRPSGPQLIMVSPPRHTPSRHAITTKQTRPQSDLNVLSRR